MATLASEVEAASQAGVLIAVNEQHALQYPEQVAVEDFSELANSGDVRG